MSTIVNVMVKMDEGPVARSIKTVGDMLCKDNVFFTDDEASADLIIIGNKGSIEKTYNINKRYMLVLGIERIGRVDGLPKNVVSVGATEMVAFMVEEINQICNAKLQQPSDDVQQPTEKAVDKETVMVNLVREDALEILVVDDTAGNQESAMELMRIGHKVTVAEGYPEAMEALSHKKFDVALLDLHMPMRLHGALSSNALKIGEEVPYGMLLVFEAASKGVKDVAIVTDLNHHVDPFSAAFDHLSQKPFTVNVSKVLMMHAPMRGGTKDWVAALNIILDSRVE